MSLELKIESFQQNGVFPLPQCNISLIHSAISIYQHNSASQGPVSAKVQNFDSTSIEIIQRTLQDPGHDLSWTRGSRGVEKIEANFFTSLT